MACMMVSHAGIPGPQARGKAMRPLRIVLPSASSARNHSAQVATPAQRDALSQRHYCASVRGSSRAHAFCAKAQDVKQANEGGAVVVIATPSERGLKTQRTAEWQGAQGKDPASDSDGVSQADQSAHQQTTAEAGREEEPLHGKLGHCGSACLDGAHVGESLASEKLGADLQRHLSMSRGGPELLPACPGDPAAGRCHRAPCQHVSSPGGFRDPGPHGPTAAPKVPSHRHAGVKSLMSSVQRRLEDLLDKVQALDSTDRLGRQLGLDSTIVGLDSNMQGNEKASQVRSLPGSTMMHVRHARVRCRSTAADVCHTYYSLVFTLRHPWPCRYLRLHTQALPTFRSPQHHLKVSIGAKTTAPGSASSSTWLAVKCALMPLQLCSPCYGDYGRSPTAFRLKAPV
jgi:hypothetical protein